MIIIIIIIIIIKTVRSSHFASVVLLKKNINIELVGTSLHIFMTLLLI